MRIPLARAWKRERLAARVAGRSGIVSKAMVRNVLRGSEDSWEKLIVMIGSRHSMLGSTVVVDAFVASLARLVAVEPKSVLRDTDALVRTVRRISAVAAAHELGVLEFDEIVAIVNEVLWDVHQVGERQRWQDPGFRVTARQESKAVAESAGEREDQAFIDAITDNADA